MSLAHEHNSERTRRGGRWLNRFSDRAAGVVITVGGWSVLAAMLGILVFLVSSAAPLLRGGEITETRELSARSLAAGASVVEMTPIDGALVVSGAAGELLLVGVGDAPVVAGGLSDGEARAWAADPDDGSVAVATADGGVRVVSVEQTWRPVSRDVVEAAVGSLGVGESVVVPDSGLDALRARELGAAVVAHTGRDEYRLWGLRFGERVELDVGNAAFGLLAIEAESSRRSWVAGIGVDADGAVAGEVMRIDRTRRLGGAVGSVEVTRIRLDASDLAGRGAPGWLFIQARGEGVLGVWADGTVRRWAPGEKADVWRPRGSAKLTTPTLTAACMAVGSRTLILGDESGAAHLVSTVSKAGVGDQLVVRRSIEIADGPIRSLRTSGRDRTIAAGLDGGGAVVVNTASGKVIARAQAEWDVPVTQPLLGGSLDRLVLVGGDGSAAAFGLEAGHPAVSLPALFAKRWYEGYDEPSYVYQSTGAAGSEPKLSLTPLIFGTLKATIVAMILSTPIAVLAALFTSEFLHPGVRKWVKPTFELMASLPSVVLGFVAAVSFAPLLRDHLVAALLLLTTGPVCVLFLSAGWRFIPEHLARRVNTLARLGVACMGLAVSVVVAEWLAGVVEPFWFGTDGAGAGTMRGWLDAGAGAGMGWPGWFMLFAPAGVVLAIALDGRILGGFWRRVAQRPGLVEGVMQTGRAAAIVAAGCVGAFAVAWALSAVVDPREVLLGTFSQRNTLLVGIVMGFAVAPLIYTIGEDAMQSVPANLRSASIAAGATPWQTATRIVLPVAGPGLFSAIMIGLGRAVGETMIVLMATGNTPEMTANIFGGFRTLSANIAVELPEAPRGGTHFRVLFLCGLTLFAMTLVVNTTAEIVRQRFRGRSARL